MQEVESIKGSGDRGNGQKPVRNLKKRSTKVIKKRKHGCAAHLIPITEKKLSETQEEKLRRPGKGG